MANPQLEMLKDFGIRHGEKFAVTITGAVFLLLVVMAVLQETIQVTPEEIDQLTKQGQQNLNRPQSDEEVQQKLQNDGVTETAFARIAEESTQPVDIVARADQFQVKRPWVVPEPGAGIVRRMPELVAVTELAAASNRGGFMIKQYDESGNPILKEDEEDDDRGRSNLFGQGRNSRESRRAQEREEAEERERQENERRRLAAGVRGGGSLSREEDEADDPRLSGPKVDPDVVYEVEGYRFVAITGVLDNKQMIENYARALKVDESSRVAHPDYAPLEIQRQRKQEDGTWTAWEDVNVEANEAILNDIAEQDDELTREENRLLSLVDPLPFLRAGYYHNVHIAKFLTDESQRKIDPNEDSGRLAGGGRGFGGGGRGFGGGGGFDGGGTRGGGGGYDGFDGGEGGEAMGTGAYFGGGGAMGVGSAGRSGGTTRNYPTSDADEVMTRSLDFTVEQGQTYRYRVRLVVYNPNKDNEMVFPGVDTESELLRGEWSEPTELVTVPRDVSPFVNRLSQLEFVGSRDLPDSARSLEFTIAAWDPGDGFVVVGRGFTASPGEVIGESKSVAKPVFDDESLEDSEDSNVRNELVNFNSRQILLDVLGGGTRDLPQGMGIEAVFEVPAVALVLRNDDGYAEIRSQAVDVNSEALKTMDSDSKEALEDAEGENRKPDRGGYGGYDGYGGEG